MHVCPNCGTGYFDSEEFCLDCGLSMGGQSHGCGSTDRLMRFRAVYKAPDEWTAVTVKELLEESGLTVIVQCIQEPWQEGITRMVEGYWGKVLVYETDALEARKLIEEYLKGIDGAVH